MAGVDVRTVQRIESGQPYRSTTAEKLLKAMGYTPEDLKIEELKDRLAELEKERSSWNGLPSASTVESFKVVRVLYAYECYVDAPVHVEVDITPVTTFDDETAEEVNAQ